MAYQKVTDKSHHHFAGVEIKELDKARALAEQIGDILRHIEYTDVRDARETADQLLGELVEADKELGENIHSFEDRGRAP